MVVLRTALHPSLFLCRMFSTPRHGWRVTIVNTYALHDSSVRFVNTTTSPSNTSTALSRLLYVEDELVNSTVVVAACDLVVTSLIRLNGQIVCANILVHIFSSNIAILSAEGALLSAVWSRNFSAVYAVVTNLSLHGRLLSLTPLGRLDSYSLFVDVAHSVLATNSSAALSTSRC